MTLWSNDRNKPDWIGASGLILQRRSQTVNGRLMHVECSCDISNCLTLSKKVSSNPNLIGIQFSRAAEADAALPSRIPPCP